MSATRTIRQVRRANVLALPRRLRRPLGVTQQQGTVCTESANTRSTLLVVIADVVPATMPTRRQTALPVGPIPSVSSQLPNGVTTLLPSVGIVRLLTVLHEANTDVVLTAGLARRTSVVEDP